MAALRVVAERKSLQDQRDFAMGEIERLRKERDEAQAQVAVYEAERSILANELRQLRAEVAKYQADEDDYVQLTPKGIALLDGRL